MVCADCLLDSRRGPSVIGGQCCGFDVSEAGYRISAPV